MEISEKAKLGVSRLGYDLEGRSSLKPPLIGPLDSARRLRQGVKYMYDINSVPLPVLARLEHFEVVSKEAYDSMLALLECVGEEQ